MKTLKTNYRIRLLATASAMTSFFFIGCSSESQQRASDDNGHSHEDAHDHEGEVDHDNDHEKKEGGPSGG
ncbi:MAG: hypothetical protein HOJ89_09755, partial [Opitutales bacterium]|nr:hypothetical protein [Opitutales bacterium]